MVSWRLFNPLLEVVTNVILSPTDTVFAPLAVAVAIDVLTATAEMLVTLVEFIFKLAVQVPASAIIFNSFIVYA